MSLQRMQKTLFCDAAVRCFLGAALALTLARDPAALAALREKLARNKAKAPLFDTDRSRRNLEVAYRRMTELAHRGEPPASFSVTEADQLAF